MTTDPQSIGSGERGDSDVLFSCGGGTLTLYSCLVLHGLCGEDNTSLLMSCTYSQAHCFVTCFVLLFKSDLFAYYVVTCESSLCL